MNPPKAQARRRRRHGERGTALIFALMVLLILSMGTAALWSQLHGNLAAQRRAWHKEQAFQLAEAGLERAIAGLRAAPDAYTGETDTPFGPGTYSVTVTPGAAPGEFTIASWGRLENASARFDRAGLRGRLRRAGDGAVAEYVWEVIRENTP